MPEAPFVAYHPVLLINPSADCAALLPRLHAHGWALEQASLGAAAKHAVDVALVRLGADSAAMQPEMLRVLRALVSAQGRQIGSEDLDLAVPSPRDDSGNTLADYVLRAERQALNEALMRYSSNMSQAARALGVSRPTFYRLLHKHRMR